MATTSTTERRVPPNRRAKPLPLVASTNFGQTARQALKGKRVELDFAEAERLASTVAHLSGREPLSPTLRRDIVATLHVLIAAARRVRE